MSTHTQTAEQLFALSLEECAEAIIATGSQVTTVVQGHIGCGKSTLLKIINKALPKHRAYYFDGTTKDLGDMMFPIVVRDDPNAACDYVKFAPNEEMGMHIDGPVILMFDEYGKMNASVKNASMRCMLEREFAGRKLHPDSIIFATTNLGTEGVGDLLLPHHRNRITVVRMKKPTATDWIEGFAYNAGIHPSIIRWVNENGEKLFQSFEEVANPDDDVSGNPYIYHPKAQRGSFVTPRSLELASHWLWKKDQLTPNTLKQALMGTIGPRGGADLEAYVTLYDQLPRQKEIMDDPMTAKIPETASAVVMVIERALSTMTREFVTPWVKYLNRLDTEAQGLFALQIRNEKYANRGLVMSNTEFTKWCMTNNYMFNADM